MSISLRHISKHFQSVPVLNDVSLDIAEGELVALLGPSGSGKTTLLRVIAGLETPDPAPKSLISFDGRDVGKIPIGQRGVGFVFQHYALFRHMTVAENIAFGLTVRPRRTRPSSAEIARRVTEWLRLVQLEGLGSRYPAELSGGQRQRVALARALAIQPRVLLLDEPFGALDASVRHDLRQWLKHLHTTLRVTSVFVTHDQAEALELADRVVVLNRGRIEQIGTPDEVFLRPATEFVMKFIGQVNQFHGRIDQGRARFGGVGVDIDVAAERGVSARAREQGQSARLLVRPSDVEVDGEFSVASLADAAAPHAPESDTSAPLDRRAAVKATITRIVHAGSVSRLELRSEHGHAIHAEVPRDRAQQFQTADRRDVVVRVREGRVFTSP